MEFKGKYDENGKLVIEPIIERKGEDLIIHLPSLSLMNQINQGGKSE